MQAQRWLGLGSMVMVTLALGCSSGDEESAGSFSATNLSYTSATTPTTMTTMTAPMTGTTTEPGSEGGPGATSDDPTTTTANSSSSGPPGETTNVDPSTTNVDPSTTAVDPSTTGSDSSSGVPPDPSSTSTMPMTTADDTTSGDPPPPPKDNQPNTGLYEHCTQPEMCDPPSNVCLQLNDMNMQVVDGFCTIFCTNVGQCGQAPNAPAIQECFNITAQQKICGLKCPNGNADCPNGMTCTNLALPPPQNSGFYCI